MSIRIYDGLLLDRPVTATEFVGLCAKTRKAIEPLARDKIFKFLSEKAMSVFDETAFGGRHPGDEAGRSSASLAWRDLAEKRSGFLKQQRAPDADCSFEIVLIPLTSRRSLLLPYCEEREWLKKAQSIFGADDYGYWDGTDRPDELDARQWRKRRADWSKALDGFDAAPGDAGLKANLCSAKFNSWWTPDLDELFPTIQASERFSRFARARRLAESLDLNAYFVEQTRDDPKPDPDSADMSRFTGIYLDWSSLARGERAPLIDAKAALIEPFIPDPTVQALQTPLGKIHAEFEALRLSLKELPDVETAAASAPEKKRPSL